MLLQSIAEYFMLEFLWLIAAGVMIILSILVFRDSKKATTDKNKKLYLGMGAFILSYALTRICFFIADYYGEYQPFVDSLEFLISIKAGYVVSAIGLTILLYVFEKEFVPTKFIFTITAIVSGILYVFLPYDLMKLIIYIFQPLVLVEILYIYIYLARKGIGDLKKRALYAIYTLIILFMGIALDTRIISDMNIFPPYLPAILVMTGLITFYYSQRTTE
jgi:hypothetical protein